ncbi:hypothetical protein BVC80_8877g9 [Macleaya cordata]|uniref:Uncharacterized protein n=1 Tax=Macleaya cordata TaxID=56857 RepID=A0A200QA55_MACCD|nr:hypothetical protein BVC80_8877g9 [Macleaya cordata]
MLSLKLVRSLVLGETINNFNTSSSSNDSKTLLLLFLPTKEIVKDTCRGLFKLVSHKSNNKTIKILNEDNKTSNWDCSSLSLFSRVTGDRIDSMDSFSRVLAGMGWTLFKTKNNPSLVSGGFGFVGPNSVFLFRKVDSNRVQAGDFRIRELRLPPLDFKNAPLRILQRTGEYTRIRETKPPQSIKRGTFTSSQKENKIKHNASLEL